MKTPKSVYRRFKQKEWADDLQAGVVWLPTFASIRHPEHPRADTAEGTARWKIPDATITADGEHQRLLLQMKQIGFIDIAPPNVGTLVLKNCVHNATADGYVLCTSRNAKLKQFGEYCVRIQNPNLFGDLVFSELERIFGPGGHGAHGWVPYGRESDGDELPNPYFLGTQNNAREEEYRFVFVPNVDPTTLQPIRLEIPWVAKLCSRA